MPMLHHGVVFGVLNVVVFVVCSMYSFWGVNEIVIYFIQSFTKKHFMFLMHNFILFHIFRIFYSFYWINFNIYIGRKCVQYCQHSCIRIAFHNTATRWRWQYIEIWRTFHIHNAKHNLQTSIIIFECMAFISIGWILLATNWMVEKGNHI